jgi:aspartyl-tRNA(Asn)/glutamyl-tRNA(Gln) amidotransferase subunit C
MEIISQQDIDYIAKLAKLEIAEDERESCREKLEAIFGYMQQLRQIDTEGVPITTHVLDLQNVFREDIPGETLPTEAALANAPESEGPYFKVPRIMDK